MPNMVGIQVGFQNYRDLETDEDVYQSELDFIVLCDQLGFDRVWIVEHHFDAYAMSPDNFVTLAHLIERTKQIKLGIGAAILPWNDPLRVAEKTALLDILAKGRVLLGMGRGLARMEYEGLRIPMSEARERFDEASEMIMRALETGVCEGDGPFYKQPAVDIRPRSPRPFRDRLFTVAAGSPESIAAAVRLGGAMMSIVQGDTQQLRKSLETFRSGYRALHGRPAPVPVLTDCSYCHADAAIAEERAHKYLAQSFAEVVKHYDFAGQHFASTKGYTSYADGAKAIREVGTGAAAQGFIGTQIWGTPEQIVDQYRERVSIIGPYAQNFQLTGGGIPYEEACEGAELIARKAIPIMSEILEEAIAQQERAAAA